MIDMNIVCEIARKWMLLDLIDNNRADSRLAPSQWEMLLYKVTPCLIGWVQT